MLLAIDVGNTNMVFGLYDGDKLRGRSAFPPIPSVPRMSWAC